jgi:trehalose/maltose hydrolase-like predicted phosphorylase
MGSGRTRATAGAPVADLGRLGDTTFEAVVVDWDGMIRAGRSADTSALGARVEALCRAGVHVFVVSARDARVVDDELRARPRGPGALHVCAQDGAAVVAVDPSGPAEVWRRAGRDELHAPCATAATDAACWARHWLEERGITGRLVLVALGGDGATSRSVARPLLEQFDRAVVVAVGGAALDVPGGVVHLGGPADLLALLDAQLARRTRRRVPWIDEDPAWTIELPDAPEMERVAEALGTVGNGHAAIRAAREEQRPSATPLFAVNGVYTDGETPRLAPGPVWTDLDVRDALPDRRVLDLRTGVLARETLGPGRFRSLRFVSAAEPDVLAMRAEGDHVRLVFGDPFRPFGEPPTRRLERRGWATVARAEAGRGGAIVVAAADRWHIGTALRTVERLASVAADGRTPPDEDAVVRRLAALQGTGFDRLLAEHRERWAQRWRDADVRIVGDDDAQLATRFAIFHLLASLPAEGEAAVGARGLTGHAYGGHVFWDADVFVLPAIAAIRPAAAHAMLRYRINRLEAARRFARESGRSGARFPWESADDGSDVTPRFGVGSRGEVIPIHSGLREEHIVADVAWAAVEYAAWTGDDELLTGAGAGLVIETARYWADRIRLDDDGRGHIDHVIGPDEYHDDVDDNAFTNVMARWNLRRGADLLEATGGDAGEAAAWRTLADRLVDGWDPATGLYEQFAGYWNLEPLLVESFAQPPVAADVVLGADRVRRSQVIKQADVLMLHHLVPEETAPGSLRANLDAYVPRTAHGSSLSPGIHAALYARAGDPERALELFRLAARLDLDDITGTTAGGLHLATMGSLWQALAYGFLGLRPAAEGLCVDPCLPAQWQELEMRLRFRGVPIVVAADHHRVSIRCTQPVPVRVGGQGPHVCEPPGATYPFERGSHEHRAGRG